MPQPYLTSNVIVLNAANLGASQTSEVIDLSNSAGFSFHVVWSGGTSTTGAVIVEVSNDLVGSVSNPVFTTASSNNVTTTSGSLMLNNPNVAYNYARLRWNRTGGSGGTITVRAVNKNSA